MHSRSSIITAVGVLITVFSFGQALAQHSHGEHKDHMATEMEQGHSHEMAMVHGGHVVMTPKHHFEVVFTSNEACVYLYDGKQMPMMDPKDIQVTMSLVTKEGKSEPIRLDYQAPDADQGRTQGYFRVLRPMDMKEGAAKAMFRVVGLLDEPIEFRTAVTLGERMVYACPMGDSDPAEDPGKCPKCGMQMKMMSHGESMEKHMGEHMDHEAHGHGDSSNGHHQ